MANVLCVCPHMITPSPSIVLSQNIEYLYRLVGLETLIVACPIHQLIGAKCEQVIVCVAHFTVLV